MKHTRLKVSRIVDELTNYCFYMGATDIQINVKETDEHFRIYFKSDYDAHSFKKVQKLVKLLDCTKQEDMEEYYWLLTGGCDVGNELSLVAMITDEAEVKYTEGESVEITLYKYKDKK